MKSVVGHSPYPKKVTVKVLYADPATTYFNDKKEKRELMNTVLADSTKAVKCVVYDSKKFHRFTPGKTIILRNIIRKPEGIDVTSATVIFPAAKSLSLPPSMEKEGIAILHPPPADVKSVVEALASPTKTKVSVRGKIVQEEATRFVTVKNEDNVKVKNIYLEDSTKKCKIALWRDLADQAIRPGDYVEVSDCITNTFRNEVSLSTTSRTAITKTECPEETVIGEIESVCVEDETTATLLLIDDRVVTAPLKSLRDAFPECKEDNIEQYLISLCRPTIVVECTFKGSYLLSMRF
ncbi:uncharacterized protein LOC125654622 [Ostrea edulis]|uniref:uncharacterized protein LOC125654622 n=1 Tax=Ostrea edulis TaxID=37623 RepID=UPI0024AFB380|nr:uncharacterized protein LOC125654622 [Ostrea edulis]